MQKKAQAGHYRKATLIEQYSSDVPLPDLLHRIAGNCSKITRWAMTHVGCTTGIYEKPVS